MVVSSPLNYFGGNIFWSPAHCVGHLVLAETHLRKSEIS